MYKNIFYELTKYNFSRVLYPKVPQLSSTRPIDVHGKFHVVPEGFEGTKRAVMVGINYVGQDGELSGCHNDVKNVRVYGYESTQLGSI
jgi:hypothetical protein